jgi:hypothetical protein
VPQVLTTNAIIVCPHGGRGTTTPSDPKWSVNGGKVLLEGDRGVLSCVFLPPCVGYTLTSMGLNATQIEGRKVILVTDFNHSDTGLPLLMAELHTTFDNSTPAPLPAGQPPPPLPPALLDVTPPVVSVLPAALTFNTMSGTPLIQTTTFTLAATHPLKWSLTLLKLINTPLGAHADLTNGAPPLLTVLPAGGQWDHSPLAVTVTMTAAFMIGLGPGTHEFHLTGVSQRGLWERAVATLTVS